MYELSIIVPGIRTNAWISLYNSIITSTKLKPEIIFVGPQAPPDELAKHDNIKYIPDFGCPTRCMQIGLMSAKGEHILWGSDDCMFLPDAIDKTFEVYHSLGPVYKKAVAAKYLEGNGPRDEEIHMDKDYYRIHHHDAAKTLFVPENYIFFAPGIISRHYLITLGGWDCRFHGLAISCLDLAIRVQRDGAQLVLTEFPISKCSWCNHKEGDHAPIDESHVENDFPLYLSTYNSPDCCNRIAVSLDNWKYQEDIWGKRFKQ